MIRNAIGKAAVVVAFASISAAQQAPARVVATNDSDASQGMRLSLQAMSAARHRWQAPRVATAAVSPQQAAATPRPDNPVDVEELRLAVNEYLKTRSESAKLVLDAPSGLYVPPTESLLATTR
jgi:hypothetical protein